MDAQAPGAPPARLTDLSLAELGDLVVTSVSKEAEPLRQTAAAVHVITNDDIRRSGATSVPEALRLAPGMQVSRVDSDHWAVGVRGFADQFSKGLLVLIDGRSVYTPLFAGMYWPAHDVVLEDVERIEVIRGPGGTIWGANAVSGVVNIITRAAADTQGASVSVTAGTIDRGMVSLRYGATAGHLAYRVYGKAFTRASQHHRDGASYDEWHMQQAGFRADWSGDGHRLTVQGDVSGGEHGQRVSVASFAPQVQFPLEGPLKASGGNLRVQWEPRLVGGATARLQGYYDRTSWDAPHFAEVRDTVDVDGMYGLAAGPRVRLLAGTGARWSPGRSRQVLPTLHFTPSTVTDHMLSVFAQAEVELVRERLWLTGGAKWGHNNYTGGETQPTVRLRWQPTGAQTLWAAATRAVRIPSRLERGIRLSALVSPPIYIEVAGSNAFQAERLQGYEAGYRLQLGAAVHLDVAVFANQHDNLAANTVGSTRVELTPAPPRAIVTFPYVNGIEGRSHGFELSPSWTPVPWWRVAGSYAYLHLDMRGKPGNVDTAAVTRYGGSSPRHQLQVQSRMAIAGRLEVDPTYRYVGALPARAVAAYHAADLRLGVPLARGWVLSVAGQNLLTPHHAEFSHDPPPAVGISRSLVATLTWAGGS
ncbi:MAG: TonB-dependent receptor plug domain-containing protein [Alphaproteobacteria bacterium]